MIKVFNDLYKRYFPTNETIYLFFFLIISVVIFMYLGAMLAPVFAGIVIAYLLQVFVDTFKRFKFPHWLAVLVTYLLFISIVAIGLLLLFPVLWRQASNLVAELPNMVGHGQLFLAQLPQRYPDFISTEQIASVLGTIKTDIVHYGQIILSLSLSSIPTLITLGIYFVLVPLLVFFFLWDKNELMSWFLRHMPKERAISSKIWGQVNTQLGNYVRGKVVEMLIVAVTSYIPFAILRLEYAALLAVLVGLSVLIPFIGVIVVTIPVITVALLQWGWGPEFFKLIVVYSIICILDANFLVPVLFSEAVKIHPVAIIIAILIFGGLWGFWGVFFAIPLAILVKAILESWPRG